MHDELSKGARCLLKLIGRTDDCSAKVPRHLRRHAQSLVDAGFAVAIPLAMGGGELVLTEDGIDAADDLLDEASVTGED